MFYVLFNIVIMVNCKKYRSAVTFMQAWEGRAYDYGMANLKSMGFPVDDLEFDADLVMYQCVPHPYASPLVI